MLNDKCISHFACSITLVIPMRYLVLTDIHANLEALEACIADATTRGYDRALVLGDLVGYGADPNAVIECVQRLNPLAIVRGNHDEVACGLGQADCAHRRQLQRPGRPLCLFGHTHYPASFELSADAFDSIGPSTAAESRLVLQEGSKYLVNPGSVGQPRDGDPRAAYAIVDVEQ